MLAKKLRFDYSDRDKDAHAKKRGQGFEWRLPQSGSKGGGTFDSGVTRRPLFVQRIEVARDHICRRQRPSWSEIGWTRRLTTGNDDRVGVKRNDLDHRRWSVVWSVRYGSRDPRSSIAE